MKYVILIHSNPQPWGHPTSDFLPWSKGLSAEERARLNAEFESFLGELHAAGELVGGSALGDPSEARLLRSEKGTVLATDGPYAEAKEHLAGFFLIDVASHERAEEIAGRFVGPGETIELRSVAG
ncbi:YciI family protein [Intrasporangium sp. DVR]|uniref:YciI family protein n=1 Tax=Intrasporangium sp. DVR TaxID=3127867 RepID=UPI00313A58A1